MIQFINHFESQFNNPTLQPGSLHIFRNHLGWSFPFKKIIDKIGEYINYKFDKKIKLLSVGSGCGFFELAIQKLSLANLTVIATDNFITSQEGLEDLSPQIVKKIRDPYNFMKVELIDGKDAVEKYTPDVLFMSWPPHSSHKSNMDFESLKAFKGDVLIFNGIADNYGTPTGSDAFHQLIRDEWEEFEEFTVCRDFGLADDCCYFYERKIEGNNSNSNKSSSNNDEGGGGGAASKKGSSGSKKKEIILTVINQVQIMMKVEAEDPHLKKEVLDLKKKEIILTVINQVQIMMKVEAGEPHLKKEVLGLEKKEIILTVINQVQIMMKVEAGEPHLKKEVLGLEKHPVQKENLVKKKPLMNFITNGLQKLKLNKVLFLKKLKRKSLKRKNLKRKVIKNNLYL